MTNSKTSSPQVIATLFTLPIYDYGLRYALRRYGNQYARRLAVIDHEGCLKTTLLHSHLNTDSHGNPNDTYDIIEKHITNAKETFLPTKTIRFNKHKHRIKSWMTENILRSIKFRDKLYKQYLSKPLNSTEKLIHNQILEYSTRF